MSGDSHLAIAPGYQEKPMPATRSADDAGFSIVESLIALGLVFGVMVGLLATVNIGIRGIVTGRQRSVALSIANEVMETARSRSYADVGHDLDSDPTLATDPAVRGTVPNLFYTDLSPSPEEPLVGSVVNAGPDAGSITNPLFPFSPHRWTSLREATTYTTSVYVTRVIPPSGDPYRRVTTIVSWDRSLNAPAAVSSSVRLSSYLYNAAEPPDPLLTGLAEADAGNVSITGSLSGIDFSDAHVWLPYAHGEIDSRFVRGAKGFATAARALTNLHAGTMSGCTVSNGGLTAECAAAKADTGADNDSATAPAEYNALGPVNSAGGTLAAGEKLASLLGAGTARSLSTARSCWACPGSSIGVDDNDQLPYQWAQATGPASLSLPFSAGPASGSLLTAAGACAMCSTVTLDRDDASSATRLFTTATVVQPALDLVTLADAPAGYAGMVRVGPTNVSTSATSGPGALAPSFIANPVGIQVYDTTTVPPGYRTVTITPGTPSETASHAEMAIGGALVVMDATVRSGPKVTVSTSSGAALSEAQASLSNWLSVEVHLVITTGTLANLVVSVDYGRVSSRATYQPAPA
jgi:hypothetical protein